MRATILFAVFCVATGCSKHPPVYDQQIASCDDEIHKTEQIRSVSGPDDLVDVQRKGDAVALTEYLLNRCFPNPFDPPEADQPLSGTVGEIIAYERKAHNRKYPYNPI